MSAEQAAKSIKSALAGKPGTGNTKSPATKFRWAVVALAFIITFINYVDRSAISYAVGPIKQEFGLDNTAFGIVSAAFGIGYVVVAVASGILVDRIGARTMWSAAAIAWSIITGMFSLASGFWSLLICRTALGAAEGPNFPSLTRVCTDWLPVHERGRATAWGLAAVPISCVIGAPLISHLIITLGWRAMFMVLASAGVIWAVVWITLFRDDPGNSKRVSELELAHIKLEPEHLKHEPYLSKTDQACVVAQLASSTIGGSSTISFTISPATSPATISTTWKFLLLNPSLLSNNFAFSAFGYLLFFSVYWLPAYLEETYGLHLREVGWYLMLPWMVAALLLPAGGWISDIIWMKTRSIRSSRSYVVAACQLLSALTFLPILFWHSLPVALISISAGLGIGLMPNAAFYMINSDLAKDRAATSLGVMNVFAAVSSTTAPVITGMISSLSGSYNSAFLLIIVYSVISVVGVLVFQWDKPLIASTHVQ